MFRTFGVRLLWLPSGQAFPVRNWSMSRSLGKGVDWSVTLPEQYDIEHFGDDQKFQLEFNLEGTLRYSPPLTCTDPEQDLTAAGALQPLSGVDQTSWYLSEANIDKPTYARQQANTICADLAGPNVTVLNAPTFLVAPSMDVHGGTRLEHLARLYHDGGLTYRINNAGAFEGLVMDQTDGTSVDVRLIKTLKRKRSAGRKVTKITIGKTSPVATHAEFQFSDVGFKTVTFTDPLGPNVNVRDASAVGSCDLITFFDSANPGNGNVVAFKIINPTRSFSTTPAIQNQSGPIRSATLSVFPANDNLGLDINARLIVDGVPADDDYDGIDLKFSTNDGVDGRPARSPIDGSLMPTKAHADAIKQAIRRHMNADYDTLMATSQDPMLDVLPGARFVWPGLPAARVQSISCSGDGKSCNTSLRMSISVLGG